MGHPYREMDEPSTEKGGSKAKYVKAKLADKALRKCMAIITAWKRKWPRMRVVIQNR